MVEGEIGMSQLRGDIIQQLDQMEAMLESTAKVMATYYKELIKQGIPAEFAEKIVLDYHHTLFSILKRGGNEDE